MQVGNSEKSNLKLLIKGLKMGWIFGLVAFSAWLNHIFTCFGQGLWGFLIAGAIFFPIGVLHGCYLWFK